MEVEKENISRGEIVKCETRKCKTPCGNIYVTVGFDEKFGPMEMFTNIKGLKVQKQIDCGWSLHSIAMAASHMLQGGFNSKDVTKYVGSSLCPEFSMLGMHTCPEFMQSGLTDMINKLKEESVDVDKQPNEETDKGQTGEQ